MWGCLAGEAWSKPGVLLGAACRVRRWGTLLRELLPRGCGRRVSTAFGWLTHAPGKPQSHVQSDDGHCYISLGRGPEAPKWVPRWCGCWVGGAAVGPQGLLPGRILQRFEEQVIDEDGVVLAVVDVPVICSDKFLQSSSLAWRCSSFRSSTEWQRRHFRGYSTGAVLGEGG